MTEFKNDEIRLDGCGDDHDFRYAKDCQHWMQQFLAYLTSRLGNQLTIKINAYYSGHIQFCVDMYNKKNASFLTTIALSPGTIRLYSPIEDQLDIVLPGIVDVFHFIRQILACTQERQERISFLEISLPGKPDAARHMQET